MSGKKIISMIKKSQKVTFTKTKNKKVVKIDDIIKNSFPRKNHMAQKIH